MRHIFRTDKQSKKKLKAGQVISPVNGRVFFLLFCFVAYSFFNTVQAQTDKAKQKEQLVSQLDANMTSFLSTVRSKREANTKQLEELRTELVAHQAKKKSKKTQASDEQIEQLLQKKIASLEKKDKEFQKMEDDALEFLSGLEKQFPASMKNASALAQSQGGTASPNAAVSTQTKTSPSYAQPSSTGSAGSAGSASAQRREALVTQLNSNMSSFVSTVSNKRVQNQQQLEELRVELAQHQAKKPNKKTQAMDEQIEQALLRKIANLEKKDVEYQKMEDEALAIQSTLVGQSPAIASSSASNTKNQQKQQLLMQLEANAASSLASIQSKRIQNQRQLEEIRIEFAQHQAKKPNKKTQAMDEQMTQAFEKKIANLEKKEKEYKKMEDEALAFQASLQTQSLALAAASNSPTPTTTKTATTTATTPTQTSTTAQSTQVKASSTPTSTFTTTSTSTAKPTSTPTTTPTTTTLASTSKPTSTTTQSSTANAQQKQQLVSKLDANAASHLASIQVKRDENQQQLEKVRVELAKQQAKTPNKKTQAVDAQIVQDLERKIAVLEKKDAEYKTMEKEVIALQTAINTTAQTATTTPNSVKQQEQLLANATSHVTTIQNKREQNQQQLEKVRTELAKQQAKTPNKKTQEVDAKKTQALKAEVAALEKKEVEYKKMETEAVAFQSSLQTQLPAIAAIPNATTGSTTTSTSGTTSKNAEQKQQLMAQLDASTNSFLSTIEAKREQNKQQLKETRVELAQQQAKKSTKKTQATDQQIVKALERKITNLENKEKEYQRMEKEAIALQSTVQSQTLAAATPSSSTTKTATQTPQTGTVTQSSPSSQYVTSTSTSTPTSTSTSTQRQTAQTSTTQKQTTTSKTQASTTTPVYAQTQTRTTTGSQSPTTSGQNTRVTYGYQPANGNITTGYYVVFGSFMERNNAERFLMRLQTRFGNVVDIGNDNMFGMYRTGIGPYQTKEEAVSHRPNDMKNWVLRVEAIPNTRMVAYIEIFDDEEALEE